MRNRLIAIILAVSCTGAAFAQSGTRAAKRSSNQTAAVAAEAPRRAIPPVPAIQEGPAPTEENASGMLGGDKPFTLIVDQENGVLDFKFNELNEVETLVAKKGVILSSEEMTLNSDQLDYDVISSKMVASGQRVVVRQGEVIATCQLFEYDPKTQNSTLKGTPVVYNTDKNGQVSTTQGREIKIFNNGGRAQFKVIGGYLKTGGAGGGAAPANAGGGMIRVPNVPQANAQPASAGQQPDNARTAASELESNRIDAESAADVQSFSKKPARSAQ